MPLVFTARGSTTAGRIEISRQRPGTLRIGAVSLMPADNIEGFRADTVALMREMDCKMPAPAGRQLHLSL